ncbi:MAG: MBL fold metallo-hydrolase [Xanthobacteraceae bacterium]|nr:MBL fold metallo-hydrolase [Xanthobacteraceae bacterium]
MSLAVTILGCGSSGGVPRPGLGWGACDPDTPRNRRRRCSLLVERHGEAGVTRILIDTAPDLREQLLDAGVDRLDAVLYTHEHADHIHGIDDLRPLVIHQRRRMDVWMDEATSRALHARFGYCFMTPPGSAYPPILQEHRLVPGTPVTLEGQGGPIAFLPFLLDHGDIPALGFRFGQVAYTPDVKALPEDSLPALAGLDLWIVDALRYASHPTHFSVDDALRWIERLAPRRAVLTNMHADIDYDDIKAKVPPHVDVAYDGMRLDGLVAPDA